MTAQVIPMRRKEGGEGGERDEYELDEQFVKLVESFTAGERIDFKAFGRAAKGYVERHRSRVPPNDLAAEAAVLSAALLEPSALDRVADILQPEAFYSDSNRRIYEGLLAIRAAGIPVDAVAVASWLRDRGWIDQVGGPAYIAQLCDATPSVANVLAHAERVIEIATRRRMIALGQRIAAEGYTDIAAPLHDAGLDTHEPNAAWLALCVRRVEDVARSTIVRPLATIGQALNEAFADLQRVEARAGRVLGLTTGMPLLDAALGGLAPSDVTLVGARMKTAGRIETTSAGKSSFAAAIGLHVAQAGYTSVIDLPNGAREERHERIGVVMFVLEMTRSQMAQRMACQVARLDWSVMKSGGYTDPATGKLFPDVWKKYMAAQEFLRTLPILFDTDKPLTPSRARAKLLAARDQFAREGVRLGLAIYDSLGLMAPDRPSRDGNREKDLNSIGRDIRLLSTDDRMPGIHHLEVTQIQADGFPKDCKSLKDHAVNNLIVDLEDDPNEDVIEGRIQITKQRDGKRGGHVPICFFKRYGLFSDTQR
jgi:replicative DNA helicase